MLETSLLNADALKEALGAGIALLLPNYYYAGNLACLYQGDITLPARFVLKALSPKNLLTIYHIKGSNLKALLEHPYYSGSEINALYAFSGLKMTYAPWAKTDANVEKVTLIDGTEILDDSLYRVAAWDTSIDARYIGSVEQTLADTPMNKPLMIAYIKAHSPIAPANDSRLTLDRSKIEE